ncbi:hypothetical protein BDQ94DRAFT_152904 [Aspergillus welwitschiae]|uniref:Uncharacterized protein n=1 Tax=Aspergillus welwitschiae TaxID=1341132 RepID=A0A3F3PNR8_9EURO|nr:hypothetical protein BDQ94DRAFT_152904 [Aspergillus welwitschiae]RDH27966.1 hypothetical protein BDQ94DRAFT_152904 [Aspergillus welwitschiae]
MTFRRRVHFQSAKQNHEAPRITAVVFGPPLRRIQPIRMAIGQETPPPLSQYSCAQAT